MYTPKQFETCRDYGDTPDATRRSDGLARNQPMQIHPRLRNRRWGGAWVILNGVLERGPRGLDGRQYGDDDEEIGRAHV